MCVYLCRIHHFNRIGGLPEDYKAAGIYSPIILLVVHSLAKVYLYPLTPVMLFI